MRTLVIWIVNLGALLGGAVSSFLWFQRRRLRLDRQTEFWMIRQSGWLALGCLIAAAVFSIMAASVVHQETVVVGVGDDGHDNRATGVIASIMFETIAAGAWFMVGVAGAEALWFRADSQLRSNDVDEDDDEDGLATDLRALDDSEIRRLEGLLASENPSDPGELRAWFGRPDLFHLSHALARAERNDAERQRLLQAVVDRDF